MQSAFGTSHGLESFLRKLAVALPANLAVFWLVLQGNTPLILLYAGIGALLGALLLTWVARPEPCGDVPTEHVKPRHRATVDGYRQSRLDVRTVR